jgi:hypothetical protein
VEIALQVPLFRLQGHRTVTAVSDGLRFDCVGLLFVLIVEVELRFAEILEEVL